MGSLILVLILRHSGGDGAFGAIAGLVALIGGCIVAAVRAVSSHPARSSYRPFLPNISSAPVTPSQSFALSDDEEDDSEFERIIAAVFPQEERLKSFYTTVAGTSHRNPDRTSRARIIRECSIAEILELRPEPENRYDANAIAVCRRSTGEQLGYLDRRLASEVTRDLKKYGQLWVAILRRHNRSPETDKVVGASICMICMSSEWCERQILVGQVK
jgi:hypothetical protein